MKASVCVLFAAVCLLAAQAEESPVMLTLEKVMNELKKINQGLKDTDTTLINSPATNDLKDCCVASALECFRSKVNNLSVANSKLKTSQKIVFKELRKSIILKSMPTCNNTEKSQCQPCNSYKKVDSRTFVQNFQTLLQKIYVSQV